MRGQRKEISVAEAYNRLASLCSRGEQTVYDCHHKLVQWGIPTEDGNAIIERLQDEDFLNEARYAKAYVHDCLAFSGWGRIKIRYQLKSKGLREELISEAMADVDEQAYVARLEETLRQKSAQLVGKDEMQAKAALIRFAASRGYEQEFIYRLVGKVLHTEI